MMGDVKVDGTVHGTEVSRGESCYSFAGHRNSPQERCQ